jgi:hypothetical protein
MAFYTGTDGRLIIDNVTAAKVINWSFTSSLQVLETTTLSDFDRTAVPGIRSSSGSCSLFYYDADPTSTSTNSASTLLNKIIKAGGSNAQGAETEKVLLELRVVTVPGVSIRRFHGDVWITSANMTMAVGEVLSCNITFEFDGAPTSVLI